MTVSHRSALSLALLALVSSGCAQLAEPAGAAAKAAPAASAPGPVAAKAGPAAAASAPAAAAPAASPGSLRPFADVVKDAKRIDGLFTLWQKDDKVWLELRPEDLNRPFFLSPKIKTGIGENFFFGGLMSFDDGAVEFRRIHNQLQLVWLNTEYVARAGTPEARAVEAAFSPSLLAGTAVLSLPHPERKSILIEANAIFVTDLLGTAMQLQRSYRQGYAFDARNSAITAVRNTPDVTVIEVSSHFATGSIAVA
jgi:Domain of unknown function (DUF5118)